MAERLASALVGELLALSDADLRPLADRLAPFLEGSQPESTFLTVTQAAARLGVHPNTVYRMIAAKQIGATRAGRLWRIPEGELARVASAEPHAGRRRGGRPAPEASRRFAALVRELPYAEGP
jgi:excisionase family DNA binding protein